MPTIDVLMTEFRPVIYIPKEGVERKMIDVLYEIHENYAILWYHWPRDDYTDKEDYEPVILVFNTNQLVAIGIRPHEKYKHSTSWDSEDGRPVIVFTTPWHGPIVKKGGLTDSITRAFCSPLVSDRLKEYLLIRGQPPAWYVKDGTNLEVHTYASRMIAELRI